MGASILDFFLSSTKELRARRFQLRWTFIYIDSQLRPKGVDKVGPCYAETLIKVSSSLFAIFAASPTVRVCLQPLHRRLSRNREDKGVKD